jgi:D-threo-aldose 1-dehydrogenase
MFPADETVIERIAASPPLGFGAATLGNLYRVIEDAETEATVAAAWAAGIRYFDTAPHYGFGLAEKRLGRALAALDPDGTAIVSTKIGRRLDPVAPGTDLSVARQAFVSPEPFESVFDYSYDSVMRGVEDSRRRLGRERIDILYAHDIGAVAHGERHAAVFRTFLDGGYRAMRALREAGVVGAIGIGVNETAVGLEMLAAGEIDVILLAGRYTLLDQTALDALLPGCAVRGVRVVIGGPFNSGILATGTAAAGAPMFDYAPAPPAIVERVRRMEAICARHDVALPAAALHFPLAHPAVAAVIPGMADPRQVAAAVAWMRRPIPSAFWQALRDEGLIRTDAPVPAA